MAKKAKGNRVQVILECTEMKDSGMPGTSRYITTKNRKNTTERLELKKYNPILKRLNNYNPWQRKQSQPFRQVKKDVLILRLSRWLNLRKQELTSSMSKWYLTKKFKTFSRNNSVGMTGGKFLSYIMEGTFFIPQCYHHNTL